MCAWGDVLLILIAFHSCHGSHRKNNISVESTQGGQGMDTVCPCLRTFHMYTILLIVYTFFFSFFFCVVFCFGVCSFRTVQVLCPGDISRCLAKALHTRTNLISKLRADGLWESAMEYAAVD